MKAERTGRPLDQSSPSDPATDGADPLEDESVQRLMGFARRQQRSTLAIVRICVVVALWILAVAAAVVAVTVMLQGQTPHEAWMEFRNWWNPPG